MMAALVKRIDWAMETAKRWDAQHRAARNADNEGR
jgi:hypothetical protein